MAVRLLASPHKFEFECSHFHLGGSEIAKHAQRCRLHLLSDSLGYLDAAPHRHEIDVFRWAVEENITHISAHHIALTVHGVGDTPHLAEHRVLEAGCYGFADVVALYHKCQNSSDICSGKLVRHSRWVSRTT